MAVSAFSRFWNNIVLRLVAYYTLILGGGWTAWKFLPHPNLVGAASLDALFTIPTPVTSTSRQALAAAIPVVDQSTLALTVAFAMTAAALLALPVSWVYTLTRAKRGYQQSVVQTLVILPVVVAGVFVLVKYSVALAFGLTGVVAAVRFRNTLDDSKDAVYIFLSTAIGLASGVDLPVAVVVSMVFNVVILFLWFTDFGRTPAQLDGVLATRRLQRAADSMTRTGTFVARMDRDLLQDMTADQLDAVAQRAKKRQRELVTEDLGGSETETGILRVRTYDVTASRRPVETILDDQLKKWEFGRIVEESDGTCVIEYSVRLKKSAPRDDVLNALRRMGAPRVVGAELE